MYHTIPYHDGRVIENGDVSDPFPVTNGVLAPTIFSPLFAEMLSAALDKTIAGITIRCRTDGRFFDLRRLKLTTKQICYELADKGTRSSDTRTPSKTRCMLAATLL
ncbi:hypothetical protein ACOMHN_028728 [Nucella lapillus]